MSDPVTHPTSEPMALPCPFCGAEAETFQSHQLSARCSDPLCIGHGRDQYFYVSLWNRRALPVPSGPSREEVEAAILRYGHARVAFAEARTLDNEAAAEFQELKDATAALLAMYRPAGETREDALQGLIIELAKALAPGLGKIAGTLGVPCPTVDNVRSFAAMLSYSEMLADLVTLRLAPAGETRAGDTTQMRRFTVYRRGDLSATHNDQQAAPPDAPQYEGVVFSDGRVALRWLTPLRSVSVWDSMDDALGVHGHPEPRYGTELVWHDAALPPSHAGDSR